MKFLLCTGISPVLNLRFSPSFSTIMWDPPPTIGVLSNLSYHLTVTNMNTGVVIIDTNTTDTSYTIPSVQYCIKYRAGVTPFAQDQRGETKILVERIPGGECVMYYCFIVLSAYAYTCILLDYYKLMNLSQAVVISSNSATSPVINVTFNLLLEVNDCSTIIFNCYDTQLPIP